MSIDGFLFEGQDRTAAEVREMLPAYRKLPIGRFQSGLERGVQTIHGMAMHLEKLAYDGKQKSYRAGGERLRDRSIKRRAS